MSIGGCRVVLAPEITGCADVVMLGSQTIVVALNSLEMDSDAKNGPRRQAFQEWVSKMAHFAEILME